jgi:hypothetical protein
MKKLAFFSSLLAVLVLVSCSKEETTTAEPGTATITLNMGVNTDVTNDTTSTGGFQTNYEVDQLAGKEVTFEVDSRDLQENPVSGYSYDKLYFTSTIGSDGVVTVTVPASKDAHTVTVKFPDLELDERDTETLNGVRSYVTESVVYTKSNLTVSVWEGGAVILDNQYYN